MRNVFLGSEAVKQGILTAHELRRWHQRLFRDVYMPKPQDVTLRDRIEGAWLRSGRQGVIAGVAASALHGAQWVDDEVPIELIWNYGRSPSGLVVRNETLSDDEITKVAEIPVTNARAHRVRPRPLPTAWRSRCPARLPHAGAGVLG